MSVGREKARAALLAMRSMGFSVQKAKPVLKNLLVVYENNWEHIESENYRIFVEAILDSEEPEIEQPSSGHYLSHDKKGKQIDDAGSEKRVDPECEEPEPYRKRLRSKQEEQRPSPPLENVGVLGQTLLKEPKLENDVSSQCNLSPQSNLSLQRKFGGGRSDPVGTETRRVDPVLPETSPRHERAGPVSSQENPKGKAIAVVVPPMSSINGRAEASSLVMHRRNKMPSPERVQNLVIYKEPKIEPGLEFVSKDTMANYMLAKPKDVLSNCDSPISEAPIAIIHPPPACPTRMEGLGHADRETEEVSSITNGSTWQVGPLKMSLVQNGNMVKGTEGISDIEGMNGTNAELLNIAETSSTNIEIASSTSGEVKLSLSCDSRPDFHMPSLESVLKMMEDRCLRSYKIIEPSFSLMNLMKEMCQCVLELGSESPEDNQENIVNITPTLDSLKTSRMQDVLVGVSLPSSNGSPNLPVPQVPGLMAMDGLRRNLQPKHKANGNNENERVKKRKEPEVSESSRSLVIVPQHEPALGGIRPLHDVNDITKGEERVRISLVNEVSSEQYPPTFYYIPQNIVYQNAYVNFSLARVGDEDCCSDCFGDCLSASIPCACARETGGEYAYTLDGLIKKEFLDDCISMVRYPQKHHQFYCKDCPLERAKNETKPDLCKGHLVQKFIKECWSKCGCNKQCGNRVVQRGITCNLQVFFTSEGKGWGLRTLDELPRGSFVCEYVGEILTNMELYDRTIKTTGNAKHTYPVLLDADWGSEGVLKDEEALCLDATFYGNVARFINHRCSDGNLVEVPVEVEAPDHHYYHLAFFTTRKIEAFEELTWDYGIDFDDHGHPIKAFRCCCGSKFCRDSKRSIRKRSGSIVLK